jgi:hypothetical protein
MKSESSLQRSQVPAKYTRKESFKIEKENRGRYTTLTPLSHHWLKAVGLSAGVFELARILYT